MDNQTKEYFNSLVSKLPENLTAEEIAFLKARRSYLDPVQKEIFGEVLGLSADEKPLSKAQAKKVEPEMDQPSILETAAEPEVTEPKAKNKKSK
jgi:hypothetical protein